MPSGAASDVLQVPKEWPEEVCKLYEPVPVLGKGGFASVMLAKEKGGKNKSMVAIKVVGRNKDHQSVQQSLTYAHREIDILQELVHPNIMKVIQSWDMNHTDKKEEEVAKPLSKTVCVMVLQYEKGPTLESLLQYGGALSNKFGCVVIAQAMNAVAYLHYRAVVHRDIKPNNLIVTGALPKDDDSWNNPAGEDPLEQAQEPNWEGLMKRWKVTLVDFGFAWLLTPDDVKKPSLELQRENLTASFHAHSMELGQSSQRKSQDGSSSQSKSRKSARRLLSHDDPVNTSFSHKFKKRMSALGNRNFAAPEIINEVCHGDNRHIGANKNEMGDLTETLSEFVSDYGLMVDSYSMGFTIRYSMTGVPPYMTVEEAMQEHNSICNMLCGGKKKSTRRSVRYHRICELPGELQRLIKHLTEGLETARVSIR